MKPLLALCVLVLFCVLTFGCATERYLTAEQDKKFQDTCEATGCAVIPIPIFEQILKSLGI